MVVSIIIAVIGLIIQLIRLFTSRTSIPERALAKLDALFAAVDQLQETAKERGYVRQSVTAAMLDIYEHDDE